MQQKNGHLRLRRLSPNNNWNIQGKNYTKDTHLFTPVIPCLVQVTERDNMALDRDIIVNHCSLLMKMHRLESLPSGTLGITVHATPTRLISKKRLMIRYHAFFLRKHDEYLTKKTHDQTKRFRYSVLICCFYRLMTVCITTTFDSTNDDWRGSSDSSDSSGYPSRCLGGATIDRGVEIVVVLTTRHHPDDVSFIERHQLMSGYNTQQKDITCSERREICSPACKSPNRWSKNRSKQTTTTFFSGSNSSSCFTVTSILSIILFTLDYLRSRKELKRKEVIFEGQSRSCETQTFVRLFSLIRWMIRWTALLFFNKQIHVWQNTNLIDLITIPDPSSLSFWWLRHNRRTSKQDQAFICRQ